eukprot:482922-Pelagomonas_calceolata.AAC.5
MIAVSAVSKEQAQTLHMTLLEEWDREASVCDCEDQLQQNAGDMRVSSEEIAPMLQALVAMHVESRKRDRAAWVWPPCHKHRHHCTIYRSDSTYWACAKDGHSCKMLVDGQSWSSPQSRQT